MLRSNDRSGAVFPFPYKLLPKVYISHNHCQEGTDSTSVAGKHIRRLVVVEPEQGASSCLGGSWSGGVDSGLFKVSLAVRTDSGHSFLRMVCT